MGKYLDIIARMDAEEARTCDQSDQSDQREWSPAAIKATSRRPLVA